VLGQGRIEQVGEQRVDAGLDLLGVAAVLLDLVKSEGKQVDEQQRGVRRRPVPCTSSSGASSGTKPPNR